jgi:signal transduction histidine kinase
MASIKGYTELVAGGVAGPVNEMQASFLDTVRSNVDRMNTIVSDLNDLTKIQVGNLRLEYHTVQIADTLHEVIRSLKRQIDEKEQVLVVELPDDLPAVWADPARLTQILTNLVSNAIKYTPQAGRILIGACGLTASGLSSGGRSSDGSGNEEAGEIEGAAGVEFVHVWVKDTGIGIAEDDQEGIFQQYYRTEQAREMASGTGLGLNITKSLVEMQGGRVWFESKLHLGTTFHFIIPLAETR